jgi:endo-1,4-beta-D-glucanase Y
MRALIMGLLMSLLASCASGQPRATAAAPMTDNGVWSRYVAKYVQPEGRVVDTANGGVSHSEGQGYGMLLAQSFGDRQQFDKLWAWTRANLQIRKDRLLAWRWRPSGSGASGAVDDMNNASDGDVLVAWALMRAADQWGDQGYVAPAREILTDLKAKAVRPTRYGPVLLPGVDGFVHDPTVTLNLAYWVFPAFEYFGQHDDPMWNGIARTGWTLLDQAKFGAHKLPPDWLLVGSDLKVAEKMGQYYGYDAMRVPLYVLWSRDAAAHQKSALSGIRTYWASMSGVDQIPARVNLINDTTDSNPLPVGVQTIATWTIDGRPGPKADAADLDRMLYYDASLALLTEIAFAEVGR